MSDQLFSTIKTLIIITKSLILDGKAVIFDIYAALHGWSSENFSEDVQYLLKDIVDYFYYVIKIVIVAYPAVLLATIVIEATTKCLDPETPEEEQFLFLAISICSGILFLAI